jgi:ABC-type transporter Mla subunit MlaD
MVGTYQDVLDAIVVWEDQYSQFIQRVVDESDDLINAFNTILTLWSQVNNMANSGEEDQPTQEDQPTKEE